MQRWIFIFIVTASAKFAWSNSGCPLSGGGGVGQDDVGGIGDDGKPCPFARAGTANGGFGGGFPSAGGAAPRVGAAGTPGFGAVPTGGVGVGTTECPLAAGAGMGGGQESACPDAAAAANGGFGGVSNGFGGGGVGTWTGRQPSFGAPSAGGWAPSGAGVGGWGDYAQDRASYLPPRPSVSSFPVLPLPSQITPSAFVPSGGWPQPPAPQPMAPQPIPIQPSYPPLGGGMRDRGAWPTSGLGPRGGMPSPVAASMPGPEAVPAAYIPPTDRFGTPRRGFGDGGFGGPGIGFGARREFGPGARFDARGRGPGVMDGVPRIRPVWPSAGPSVGDGGMRPTSWGAPSGAGRGQPASYFRPSSAGEPYGGSGGSPTNGISGGVWPSTGVAYGAGGAGAGFGAGRPRQRLSYERPM